MNLENYYNLDGARLSFSRQQASKFAKSVAGDFNTLHDVDSTRFCVPGDLLFAVIIKHYGLRQVMGISFSDMVDDTVNLILPEVEAREISIYDENDRKFLDVSTDGARTTDPKLIESLIRSYVEFSGHSFPHVLVPVMKQNGIMINTDRPLVIYDHMRISLDTLDIDSVDLELSNCVFRIYGKRGDIALNFDLLSDAKPIGKGQKKLVVAGLREYDQARIDELVAAYTGRKEQYLAANQ